MEFLTSWIEQLVLVVILATFLELLLPSNTMQRYVRFTMGLIILMVILSPILNLVKSHWSIDLLLKGERASATGEMASLAAIEDRAESMRREQEQQIEEQTQAKIERQIAEGIKQKFPYTVQAITVKLTEKKQQPTIDGIAITLRPAPNREKQDGDRSDVEPVKPVTIEVGEPPPSRQAESRSHSAIAQNVRDWVAGQYQVDKDRISVQIAN